MNQTIELLWHRLLRRTLVQYNIMQQNLCVDVINF